MVFRGVVLALALIAAAEPAAAQFASPWGDGPFWERKPRSAPPSPWLNQEQRFDQWGNPLPPFDAYREGSSVKSGGPRPAIAAAAPPIVPFLYDYPANSIVIDSSARRLYFVLDGRMAYEYPISVGREGFDWTGTETISRQQEWPDWYPPVEMRARDPRLPEKMTGGLNNPLGALALYLGNSLYRIHGANDEKSIGQAASSGCFRMRNASVVHLAQLAVIGTPVSVVHSLAEPKGPGVAQAPAPAPNAEGRSSLGGPGLGAGVDPVDRESLDALPEPAGISNAPVIVDRPR